MNDKQIIAQAQQAKQLLIAKSGADRTGLLKQLIKQLRSDKQKILEVNGEEVEQAKADYSQVHIDRMTLTPIRFDDMLSSVEEIAGLTDIIGQKYDQKTQSSGIKTAKMTVPIGVILMIYESRPNVTVDAAALAIRTGNVIILKGGNEVKSTNEALYQTMDKAIHQHGFPKGTATAITDQAREVTAALLKYNDAIDLVIPRGSRKLLEFVQANTTIPTLLHLEGNCHVYIDDEADPEMAIKIAVDAKTQRLGTCNTAESILVHRGIAQSLIPKLCARLAEKGVEIRGDDAIREMFNEAKKASEDDWSKEYLAPIISIKVINNLDEAIKHINKYGSGHTDTIITENSVTAEKFLAEVDSSSVMHNTSTRLADGFEYGLGAEIGISTGKLHARGPVGQEGLTTYKWIVESNGVTKG